MQVQVQKTHYEFDKYVDPHRWNSYYYQLVEALNTTGKEVLVIGVGDGIVSDLLSKFGKNVMTFDFDKALSPDIVGSVTEIEQVLTKKYDVVLCCQVLEHIPFSDFESTVKQIAKCTTEKFILSLPNNSAKIQLRAKVPKIPDVNIQKLVRKPLQREWSIDKQGFGEHYWEINAKGYSMKKVIGILEKYYCIEKRFLPSDNMYHVFFILKPLQ